MKQSLTYNNNKKGYLVGFARKCFYLEEILHCEGKEMRWWWRRDNPSTARPANTYRCHILREGILFDFRCSDNNRLNHYATGRLLDKGNKFTNICTSTSLPALISAANFQLLYYCYIKCLVGLDLWYDYDDYINVLNLPNLTKNSNTKIQRQYMYRLLNSNLLSTFDLLLHLKQTYIIYA